ncbi:hypothetical protein AeRB84_021278 [Aphanomyces euteiches]|nr:hypothetical protein AeRB84_021278 [Aphanomyces euteiches]
MTRKYSTLDNISDTALLKWMHILTQRFERTVTRILPSKFALVFDGWTTGSTHYVAIFATIPSSDVISYKKILLSFSPINDEDSLSALSHKTYFKFELELFGKSLENVVALIGDNCSTNRALARLCGIPLVGCASHRMNLFVCTILTDHEELVNLVNELMRKLRHVVPAAKLRRLTPLKAKMKNSTRWSSTNHMLQRYVEIKPFVMMIGGREIDALLPSVGQDRLIDDLLLVLKDLDTATLALQGEEMSLLDVRNLFDDAMDDIRPHQVDFLPTRTLLPTLISKMAL